MVLLQGLSALLCSWGVGVSGTPSGLSFWKVPPILRLLMPPSPRPRVLVLGLPGPPANLSLSPSPWQDCENYITLLERQGEGLLICGTNARRPSCWSLVRGPLPVDLVSAVLSGWASPWWEGAGGALRLASPCIESLERGGPWLGSWHPWEAVAMASHGCLTLLGVPQVNGTVESLGERRGYAPFSPDENSLVLFDGRAAALGWGRAVSSVSGGPGVEEGLPGAVCPYPWPSPHAQGTRCTPQSGSRNTTGRSPGSAASRARSSCTPVIPSCRVNQAPAGPEGRWVGSSSSLGGLPEGRWGHSQLKKRGG